MTKSELAAFIKATISETIRETVKGFEITQEDDNNYCTIVKVAEKFKVTKATVHNWAKSGSVKKYKINGRTLYRMSEIEMLFNRQTF